MFFPISWISPLTVARITVPRFSRSTPSFVIFSFMIPKAARAASALIKSCGRNTVPASKPFPTSSRAGIISRFMTVRASAERRAFRAAVSAAWIIPFFMLRFKGVSAGSPSSAAGPWGTPDPSVSPVPWDPFFRIPAAASFRASCSAFLAASSCPYFST